jgi:hypothetical protein
VVTPGVPDPPTGLSAAAISSTRIDLTWTDGATGETGFKIERKAGATGAYGQIATVGADAASYNDTSVSVSTTYFYRVFAYNPTGDSQASNETAATTPGISVAGGGGGGGGCFVSMATPSHDR